MDFNQLLNRLSELTALSDAVLLQILESAVAIIVVLIIRTALVHLVRKNIEDTARLYRVRRAINYTCGFIALLVIGRIWFTGLHDLGVLLGLAAAGLAIALKEPLLNLAAWLYILIRRPYVVGDRIETTGTVGDVIDIRMFQTYLLECGKWVENDQSTGRIVLIPNGVVFHQTVVNYTLGFEPIWEELALTITFESDWQKAKSILSGLLDQHASEYCEYSQKQLRKIAGQHLIYYGKLTPIVYTSIRENGVRFSLRYLTPPRQRRTIAQRIWESVLEAFAKEPSIQFAYPTTRFYENRLESKRILAESSPEGEAE